MGEGGCVEVFVNKLYLDSTLTRMLGFFIRCLLEGGLALVILCDIDPFDITINMLLSFLSKLKRR